MSVLQQVSEHFCVFKGRILEIRNVILRLDAKKNIQGFFKAGTCSAREISKYLVCIANAVTA